MPSGSFKSLPLSLEPRLDPELGPGAGPLPPNPTAASPTQGPVIATQGLTQSFLPLPASSSWKSPASAAPASEGPGG